MGKNRSVELSLGGGDGFVTWTALPRKFYAELIIGEDTYLYLTEKEYRALERRVLEQRHDH